MTIDPRSSHIKISPGKKKEMKERNSVNYVDKDISCVKQIKKTLDIVAVALIVRI